MNRTKSVEEAEQNNVGTSVYLRCINNHTYFKDDSAETFDPELVVGQIYKALPTSESERAHGLVRIVDDSGEAYLYPADYFVPVRATSVVRSPNQTLTIHLDEITKGILHAEALVAQKSMSALVREWIDERLDLPVSAD